MAEEEESISETEAMGHMECLSCADPRKPMYGEELVEHWRATGHGCLRCNLCHNPFYWTPIPEELEEHRSKVHPTYNFGPVHDRDRLRDATVHEVGRPKKYYPSH